MEENKTNQIRPIKPDVAIEDIMKLDIRAGRIEEAELIEGTELIKQQVDFGPEIGKRQIVSKIAKFYDAPMLNGVTATYILNLPPRKIRGVESQGMIVAIDELETNKVKLLLPIANPGSIIF